MSAITIRTARPADARELDRLAELDSRHVPAGDVLVAEVDGEIVAAHGATGTVADPFRPTADAVELLRVRSATGHRRSRSRRRGHLRLHLRPA